MGWFVETYSAPLAETLRAMPSEYDRFLTHTRSRRLRGFDYRRAAWYFVTICMLDRSRTLGRVRGGIVGLSQVGTHAHRMWAEIPTHYTGVRVGAFVVMPDHMHGLVALPDASVALATVVGTYKAAVTRAARRGGHPFAWQPRFYDRVVRDDDDLARIGAYIENNPAVWDAKMPRC